MSKNGVVNNRAEIISSFTHGRTDSAMLLNQEEIDILCRFYEIKTTETIDAALDKKRKRVIAAIFGMFEKMNKTVNAEYVKAIACRASSYKNFNDIPSARLDSLYNAFLNAQKDLQKAGRLVEGYILEQQNYN